MPVPPPARPARFGARALLVTALVAGLVGGVAGGAVGTLTGAGDKEPTATGTNQDEPVSAPMELTESVAAIADQALPSVVTIDVSSGSEGGTGSGVIIRPDGYILTNNHVVAPAAEGSGGRVAVSLYKQLRQIPAEIVGRDPKTDLAVIKVDVPEQLPAATLGRSGSLVVGAPVVAIGAPLGLSGTVTTGIVSALDRNPTVPGEDGRTSVLIGAIQIDAAINPGNSGGALLDGRGQVVGINTAIAAIPGAGGSGQSGSIGVGFAIPIDYARSVAEEIIATGRATHPFIGVSAATITPQDAEDRGTAPGAFVRDVEPGGPADEAGIRPGDIITEVDDMVISGSNDLIAATRLHRIGDRVAVTFERDRATMDVEVTLREQRD